MLKTDVVKKAYDELFKKVNAIGSKKQNLKKKPGDGGKKITDTSKFIEIH